MNLYLDIETIGSDDPAVRAELAAGIEPPGNMSKPETIAAWERDKKPGLIDEAVLKTSFDGALGRVVCVGIAVNNGEPQTFIGAEAEILASLALVKLDMSAQVIGHNVGWDIRFLWQRHVVNNLPPPPWLRLAIRAKPWDIQDTMLLWNPDKDRRTSLDKLCRILGIPTPKSEMDGSKVWAAYREGRIADIAAYCAGDVRATRACYLRLTA